MIKPRCGQRQVQRGHDIGGAHVGAQLPGDDVAGEVVQHRREVVPAPACNLEIGEVGLPHLVDGSRLVFELIRRLDYQIGRACDQIVGLQQAIDRGFRDKVTSLVGEAHSQLAW